MIASLSNRQSMRGITKENITRLIITDNCLNLILSQPIHP